MLKVGVIGCGFVGGTLKVAASVATTFVALGLLAGTPTGLFVNGVSVGDNTRGDGWEFDKNRIWINTAGKTYTISGTDATHKVGVHVMAARCTIVSDRLVLSPTEAGETIAAFCLSKDKETDVALQLKGVSRFTGGNGQPGLGVPPRGKVTISQATSTSATLHCQGGTWGAGIGGGWDYPDAGKIIISSGEIHAHGAQMPNWELGGGAAGIGGGGNGENSFTSSAPLGIKGGNGGTVTINGGTVYAYGTGGSAGIGGACGANQQGWDHTGGNGGLYYQYGGRVYAYGSDALTMSPGPGAGVGAGSASRGGGGLIVLAGGTLHAEAGQTNRGCMDLGPASEGLAPKYDAVMVLGGSLTTKYGLTPPLRTATSTTGGEPVYEALLGSFKAGAQVVLEDFVAVSPNGIISLSPYVTKDLYTATDGKLHLHLPNGTYMFRANATAYILKVAGLAAGRPAEATIDSRYAVWFDAGGGTGAMMPIYCDRGKVYALPAATYTNGTKKFAGWAGTNGKRYDNGMLVFDLAAAGGKVTMKAIWE